MSAPVPAVSAIVSRDGELLFVRRARHPAADRWALPGGRVEPGESLHEAVVREVAEETGLDVLVADFVGWSEQIGDDHHFVILTFHGVAPDPTQSLRPGDDAADARWVPVEEVASLALVAGVYEFLVEHHVIPAARTFEL